MNRRTFLAGCAATSLWPCAQAASAPWWRFDQNANQVLNTTAAELAVEYCFWPRVPYVKRPQGHTLSLSVPTRIDGRSIWAAGSPILLVHDSPYPTLIQQALAAGLVVVQPNVPTSLVDLKACVRYLRANAATFPGGVEKIFAVGRGYVGALLGASGNYLFDSDQLALLGAAEAVDTILGAAIWSPVHDWPPALERFLQENPARCRRWWFQGENQEATGIAALSACAERMGDSVTTRYGAGEPGDFLRWVQCNS